MQTDNKKLSNIKFLILGDSGTGKTNILQRFVDDTFNISFISTIGIDFKIKNMKFEDEEKRVYIWDTAGQERFRFITRAYYRGAMGTIIVYDITHRESFNNVEKWIKDIKSNSSENMSIILVGNKKDLEDIREISYEEGIELSNKYGISFYETSAKNNYNIDEAFENLFYQVCNKMKHAYSNNTDNMDNIEKMRNAVILDQSNNKNLKQKCEC